jgi:hypothetical protein
MTVRRGALGLLCALSLGAEGPILPRELGRAIFVGEQAVDARMVGHQQRLPAEAARCVNCHVHRDAARYLPPGDAGLGFGPALDAAWLTGLRTRRGGPPSRYDRAAFCRALAEGVDPAYVMLQQAMPRYALGTEECEALWTFLTAP